MNYTKANIVKAIKNNNVVQLNELLEIELSLDLLKSNDIYQITQEAIKTNNIIMVDIILTIQLNFKLVISCFQICYLIYIGIKTNNIDIVKKITDKFYNNELLILDNDKNSLIRSAIKSNNIEIIDSIITTLYVLDDLTDYDRYDLMMNKVINRNIIHC